LCVIAGEDQLHLLTGTACTERKARPGHGEEPRPHGIFDGALVRTLTAWLQSQNQRTLAHLTGLLHANAGALCFAHGREYVLYASDARHG
jgi:hypothetical protein